VAAEYIGARDAHDAAVDRRLIDSDAVEDNIG
jgi:hypothetical protein